MKIFIFVLLVLIYLAGYSGITGQFVGPPPGGSYCFPGFTQHGRTCYRYVNFVTTWAQAWVYCSAMNSHLVSIETADENMILTEIIRNFTKGLNDTRIERTWTSGTNLQGTLQWQNSQSPITYTAWASGEPYLATPGDTYCVMKYRNSWYADNCNHERRFICEAEIDGLTIPIVDSGTKPSSKQPNVAVG